MSTEARQDLLQARTRDELWSSVGPWRAAAERIALVPTMGNLHEGHLALVAAARRKAARVICSIYVNPAQFGAGEDFDRYPRTPENDLRQLRSAGCDLAFLPDDAAMYPGGLQDATRVKAAPSLAGILEGASRPGHFDGVVTVVARLFNLCRPDFAVFGEKDYQQLLIVRRLVEDLGYPLEIVAVPTVRGAGGLALSSRNRYLGDAGRRRATVLSEVLEETAAQIALGDSAFEALEHAARERLEAGGFRVAYVVVRRAADLGLPKPGEFELRVLAAGWLGETRLLDNRPVLRNERRSGAGSSNLHL